MAAKGIPAPGTCHRHGRDDYRQRRMSIVNNSPSHVTNVKLHLLTTALYPKRCSRVCWSIIPHPEPVAGLGESGVAVPQTQKERQRPFAANRVEPNMYFVSLSSFYDNPPPKPAISLADVWWYSKSEKCYSTAKLLHAFVILKRFHVAPVRQTRKANTSATSSGTGL